MEGSVLARANNVVIYATSNRRHLLSKKAADNAASKLVDGELYHGEAVEEKISLSDRFVFGCPSTRCDRRSIWTW